MKYIIFAIGAGMAAALIIYFYYYFAPRAVFAPSAKTTKTPTVIINDTAIPVEIARGMRATQQGLSGRPSLDAASGMLFIFSAPARHQFWMPDMRFPIDIIWINNGKVVDVSRNASNDFNILKPRFYRPKEPAQYVLEVNAGFAEKKGIVIGDTVLFKEF